MKKKYKLAAIVLLLINGLGAMFGGWSLITDPSGQTLAFDRGMPAYSPFQDFLIPGIVLFTVIGLFSLVAAVLTHFEVRFYHRLIFWEGAMLTIFLSVELVLGFFFPFWHIPFYALAFTLMYLGYQLAAKTGIRIV